MLQHLESLLCQQGAVPRPTRCTHLKEQHNETKVVREQLPLSVSCLPNHKDVPIDSLLHIYNKVFYLVSGADYGGQT